MPTLKLVKYDEMEVSLSITGLSYDYDNAVHLSKHNEPIEVTENGISKYFNDEHTANAISPIVFNDSFFSNEILFKLLQYSNAASSIDVNDDGVSICFNDEQLSNADSPIVDKEESLSRVICSSGLHLKKLFSPIDFTEDGISIRLNEVH